MGRQAVAVEGAYQTLGLEQGASLEEVKSSYKQLALRTHPDRNPDNPDATAKFQEIGAAYTTLVKHLSKPAGQRHTSHFGYDSDDSDGNYYYSSEDSGLEEDLDYFVFVFDEESRGHPFFFGMRPGYHGPNGFRLHVPVQERETEEQYQERLERRREERKAAEERALQERQQRKEIVKADRERERQEAEKRQKQRLIQKKEEAEGARKAAAQKVREQTRRAQAVRSATFAAARMGDSSKVKDAVYRDNVDAAGGEVKRGADEFVETVPEDPQETLLHIAASRSDLELVKWLVDHNAEPDERNSAGFTALQVAMQNGHIPIVKYFFHQLPHTDSDNVEIYAAPNSATLLRISMESSVPELVWMVLENGLATAKHIIDALAWICSPEGSAAVSRRAAAASSHKDQEEDVLDEMKNLLMAYGKFTPPASPTLDIHDLKLDNESRTPSRLPRTRSTNLQSGLPTPSSTASVHNPTPRVSPAPSDGAARAESSQQRQPRGRGRGRGRARGRGNSRGRARGTP